MKLCLFMMKILFTLLFTAGQMRYNFVSCVVWVKKCKQTKARYKDKHVGFNNAGIY